MREKKRSLQEQSFIGPIKVYLPIILDKIGQCHKIDFHHISIKSTTSIGLGLFDQIISNKHVSDNNLEFW